MLMMNPNSSTHLVLLMSNSSSVQTGGGVALPKESFSNVLAKNIMAMMVWLTLSIINSSMVHTFLHHSLFYENSRYIMFICMVVNDALQLTLVTTLYVVSYIFRKIHVSVCCFLVMTAVLTTRSTPLILAGMAVERFIAICFPLHYSHTCTVSRTLLLIGVILILTATPPVTDLLITVLKEPPSFFHRAIFCDQSILFPDPSIYYKNCVFDGLYLSFVALTLLYTYVKIILTAQAASTSLASVKRARNTVLLHGVQLLLCMLAFVVPSLQAALISLFPQLSLEIRYIFFLLVYIIPRFMSPVIYGFRDELFRKYWIRDLSCQRQRYCSPGRQHSLAAGLFFRTVTGKAEDSPLRQMETIRSSDGGNLQPSS
ncbi:odorant receptor 131-2 [Fundulus heteroclitus]|uniref:odorant receptor 131-2 n=1 Tax=Fundulus heteroclitus TaxID=8078 RepID=UPI00165C9C40|nr:odorant receptor 131-2 [Fundulus heteroclitus]